jgi:hypothetical protein
VARVCNRGGRRDQGLDRRFRRLQHDGLLSVIGDEGRSTPEHDELFGRTPDQIGFPSWKTIMVGMDMTW